MINFCTMLAELLEKVVTDNKRYHLMGAFLLDKEIRSNDIYMIIVNIWINWPNICFVKHRFNNILLECNTSECKTLLLKNLDGLWDT